MKKNSIFSIKKNLCGNKWLLKFQFKRYKVKQSALHQNQPFTKLIKLNILSAPLRRQRRPHTRLNTVGEHPYKKEEDLSTEALLAK